MNKWTGIGRLTRDPEIRYTNSQTGETMCIARYTLAVDRRFAKKNGGDNQQTADFISCVAFGKIGEFAEKYLKQGTKIAVIGRIQTGSYTNKDGQKVYTTDVVVEECEFAESKNTTSQPTNTQPEPQKASDDVFMNIPEGLENELPFR
jgi:single-strand DNA-binding protein